MSTFPGASFGTEGGLPVYIVREWSPGVETVHEIPGGYGVPYYTPVFEYRSGVKLIMLDGDGLLAADRARLMTEQQAQAAAAYAASTGSAAGSTDGLPAAGASGGSMYARLLLLG